MRRRHKVADVWPAWLTSYRPEDWPGACHPECAYWQAALELASGQDEDSPEMPELDAPCPPFHPELL